MSEAWVGIMVGVSTVVLGGGIKWVGTKLTRTWDSLGSKLDDQSKTMNTITNQVNRIEDRVTILWAERTGSTTVDRNHDRL